LQGGLEMWRRYELKKKRIKNGGRQGPQIRGVVEGIRAEREREREREDLMRATGKRVDVLCFVCE
jgi:hypothetical protein